MPVELAIVPVAGQGTGLLPLTKSQPKEMLPVGKKPAVQYVVEELAHAGLSRILFVTGPGKQSIENHFDINAELIANLRESGKEELLAELDFERHDLEYFYTRQRRQLGVGHAIRCARAMASGEPFVIALGDSLIGRGAPSSIVRRLIDEFERSGADAVVALEEVPPELIEHSGIAKPRSGPAPVMLLEDLVEKPARGEAPSNLALAARYVCAPALFSFLERTSAGKGGAIQLTDALRLMLREGGTILGVRLEPSERRYDIGDFASYFHAFLEYALADPKHGPVLEAELRRRLALPGGDWPC